MIEFVGGILTGSLAIASDAIHDFGDSISLGFAIYLERNSQRPSNSIYSYGYRRLSLLSSAITSFVLILGSIWILKESWERWQDPVQPHAEGMIALAILGLVVNGASFLYLKPNQSWNEKVLRWHFLEDILGWLSVLIVAIVMQFWHAPWLDTVLAVGISLWVLVNVYQGLRKIIRMFLQGLPDGMHLASISKSIAQFPQVQEVHHLHLWTLDGHQHIATGHVVLKKEVPWVDWIHLRTKIKEVLLKEHGVFEATLELEFAGDPCSDPAHK